MIFIPNNKIQENHSKNQTNNLKKIRQKLSKMNSNFLYTPTGLSEATELTKVIEITKRKTSTIIISTKNTQFNNKQSLKK